MVSLAEARRVVARADKEKEKQLEARSRAGAEALVGKCFKFLNSGGGDRWWLYVRVLGVVSVWRHSARLKAEHIQAASSMVYGVSVEGVSVEVNDMLNVYGGNLGSGYVPITLEEYERETDKILGTLGLKRQTP